MEIPIHTQDLPVTPTGRQSLAPDLYTFMNLAMGLKHEIDLEAIKSHFSNSIMLKIPRFSSLLVKHDNNGRYYFRPTRVNIDKHIIVHQQNRHTVEGSSYADDNTREQMDDEDIINGYLADLAVSDPLSTDKPLWELHVLMDVKCLVLRVHHAICDGTTLMSVINEIGGAANGDTHCASGNSYGEFGNGKPIKMVNGGQSIKCSTKSSGRKGLLEYLVYLWYSVVFCTQLVARSFLKDKKTAINNGEGYVRLRPYSLASARFSLNDFNMVRKAIPHATINDVLTGVLWAGLVRYLDAKSKTALQEGEQITGVVMVNMRKQKGLLDISEALNHDKKSSKSRLGNNTSIMLVPLQYTRKMVDPLDYVRKAKSIMDKKKQSYEPHFLLKLQKAFLYIFGIKLVNYLTTTGGSNSTFAISNVVGPSREMEISGNPVTYVKLSFSSSPVRLMMHMVSYMKNLDLQILAAKDVISDPKLLAECFTETMTYMKNTAEVLVRTEDQTTL